MPDETSTYPRCKSRNSVFKDSQHNSSDITQLGASVSAGRDLQLDAKRDISVIASQIDAKRDITMKATGN